MDVCMTDGKREREVCVSALLDAGEVLKASLHYEISTIQVTFINQFVSVLEWQ